MSDLLTDDELDVAIDVAHREWLRLVRIRAVRRYRKTIAADPSINERKYTPEVRAKMSAALKGKPRSPEARAAVAAGIRAGHERRRGVKKLAQQPRLIAFSKK